MTTTILTFVDEAYLPVARNWLVAIARLGLTGQVLVVTLDQASERSLAGSGIRLLHRPWRSPDLNDLWIHRVRVMAELLDSGADLVHSDADAVWLGDPLPALTAAGFDLVFTQGTVWPPRTHARRGFVLCCGLYGVRNTPATRMFFARFVERVERERDDQAALNALVDEEFGDWVVEAPYAVPFRATRFICSRTLMTARAPDLALAVLPHHAYPRLMQTTDGVVVGHPLSGKTCGETRLTLQQKGLWFLGNDS